MTDNPYYTDSWPLSRILSTVDCGSGDWDWEEEWLRLNLARGPYLDSLEKDIRTHGVRTPVLIGSDGRLWDGHHRLCVAVRMGLTHIPVQVHRDFPVPRRIFWSPGWDSSWWLPLILAGWRGGDEWCNRTVGLRLPGGALFACLNIPLRREPCDKCTKEGLK